MYMDSDNKNKPTPSEADNNTAPIKTDSIQYKAFGDGSVLINESQFTELLESELDEPGKTESPEEYKQKLTSVKDSLARMNTLQYRQTEARIDWPRLQRDEIAKGTRKEVSPWAKVLEAFMYMFQDVIIDAVTNIESIKGPDDEIKSEPRPLGREPHAAIIAGGLLLPEILDACHKLKIDATITRGNITIEHPEEIILRSVDEEANVIPDSDWARIVAEMKASTNKELLQTGVDHATSLSYIFQQLVEDRDEWLWVNQKQEWARDLEKLRQKLKPKQRKPRHIKGDALVMANNKIRYNLDWLTEEKNIGHEKTLVISPEKKIKKAVLEAVKTRVMCEYENLPEAIQKQITPDDLIVHDAICSIWDAAEKQGVDRPVISVENIYEMMPGGQTKLHEGERQRLISIVEKLSCLRITIDANDELRRRHVDPKQTKTICAARANVLYTVGAEFKEIDEGNGPVKKFFKWQLLYKPILLTYAQAVGQVIRIPIEYLTPTTTNEANNKTELIKMSPSRRAMYSRLLQRICSGKDAKATKQNNIIRFEDIFRAGASDQDGNKKRDLDKARRDREYIIQCLDFLKAKSFIKDYKLLQNSGEQVPHGFEFTYDQEPAKAEAPKEK